jgi:hypothetical protein
MNRVVLEDLIVLNLAVLSQNVRFSAQTLGSSKSS